MAYQKLRGDHLFDGKKLWGNDVVLLLNEQGKKLDIVSEADAGDDVRYVPGAILPGLVNAHCHLELSHLKGRIAEKTGLVDFLGQVVRSRQSEFPEIEEAIVSAIAEMEADGIRAVGDICNTEHTIPFKSESKIRFHNFIELISLTEAQLETRGSTVTQLLQTFQQGQPWPCSLSPHAPYTVHPAALRFLNDHTEGQLITMHNQESAAENELFQKGTGEFLNLYQKFGHSASPIPIPGTSSIRAWLPYFNRGQRILLVHNTFMSEEDIIWAKDYERQAGITLYHCFCVNANLYIENRLPNLETFIKQDCRIVLGTDSLSSNWSLRLSEEISTILLNFDSIPLSDMLQWSGNNGWEVLGLDPVWISGSAIIEHMQHRN